MNAPANDEIDVATPPEDSISCLKFSPTSENHLLVGSWDNEVRLYDLASNEMKSHFSHKAAVLSCCWGDSNHAYSGGLDTWVRAFDLTTEKETVLGAHTATVSSIVHSSENSANTIYTGSWDQTVRLWDPRAPRASPPAFKQMERVYAMDATGNSLVVALAGRLVNVYDMRKMIETGDPEGHPPGQRRESSLRFMTRTVACMRDGKGFAISSVEGRIALEYFDPAPVVQNQKYAFKCHRQNKDGIDYVWPVNALAFHPLYNTFASGGSDGMVSLWDHYAKKRLRQIPRQASAVTALAYSPSGDRLAIGVSYCWDDGEAGLKKERDKNKGQVVQVRIKHIGDDGKPRSMQPLQK